MFPVMNPVAFSQRFNRRNIIVQQLGTYIHVETPL